VAPPSEVVTTLGQSRKPQGTLPSTHQRLALTAVNDSGTNPGGAEGLEGVAEVGPADAVVVDSEAGDVVFGDLEAAAWVDSPQPASNPVASNVAEPAASTVSDRLTIFFRMTSETSSRPVRLRVKWGDVLQLLGTSRSRWQCGAGPWWLAGVLRPRGGVGQRRSEMARTAGLMP
jgi:hypothetical protein